jgi:hypothetical protein
VLIPWNFGTQVKSIHYSLLQLNTACKLPTLAPINLRHESTENMSRGLYPLLWRHRLRGSVFTQELLRNGLHNRVVLPLLGADGIENTASCIVACWTVFTELLPGNVLIKFVNSRAATYSEHIRINRKSGAGRTGELHSKVAGNVLHGLSSIPGRGGYSPYLQILVRRFSVKLKFTSRGTK